MGAFTGFNYASIEFVAKMEGVELTSDVWRGFKYMENLAVSSVRQKVAKEREKAKKDGNSRSRSKVPGRRR